MHICVMLTLSVFTVCWCVMGMCEIEYLREVLEILMFLLLPPDDFHNTICRFVIRVSELCCLSVNSVCVVFSSAVFIRSTLRQSRPNKAGLKCSSVHTYTCTSVRPQKVILLLMKFGMYAEVDE